MILMDNQSSHGRKQPFTQTYHPVRFRREEEGKKKDKKERKEEKKIDWDESIDCSRFALDSCNSMNQFVDAQK